MTHFAWLQTRTQTLVTAATMLVLAAVAAVTGVQLSHLFHANVAHCTGDCGLAIDRFLSHDRFLDNTFDILARVAPALIGIFWGAPLFARELETGTYRLAWTQSVPRSRWVATKLAVGAAATVLLAGAPGTRSVGSRRSRCSTDATSRRSPTRCSRSWPAP